ncbi:MAG TPA: hypothetical protein VGJ00_10330 [Rhabdochlamydiaceae bacterium]|jgi:hypothetical protein
MTFTFTNYAGIEPQRSPFHDLIGKILSGYGGAVNARYMPREKEADIFHKQISPLAMLASSPYFSSLHPEQQQQIAGYVQQMLSKQMQGSPLFQGMSGIQGIPQGQANAIPQNQSSGFGAPNMQMPQMGNPDQSLAPQNAAEHFTKKFTQSSLAPGAPFRGASGETVYTPPSGAVSEGINVLTNTKGLKKLFDQYASTLPELANAPEVQKSLSRGASEVEKLGERFNLPFTKQISNILGGNKLSQQQASIASLKAQMGPSLRALHFNNDEINDMFSIHPGENRKNVKDRLMSIWPVIEKRINLHRKNLEEGVNVSKRPLSSNDMNMNNESSEGVPLSQANGGHVLLMAPDGTRGWVPADKASELIRLKNLKRVS